jgi:hypothetical protein
MNHWIGLKHILSYLNTSKDRGITYGKRSIQHNPNQMYCYADADYANDEETRRSRTGFVTLLNGGAVTWRSHLQRCVSLSSTEAEYNSASEACKEVLWCRQLLQEIHEPQETTIIFEDNSSCINIANNPIADIRTKHIQIKTHHIRECIANGEVNLQKISTNDQLADVLTKNISAEQFHTLHE